MTLWQSQKRRDWQPAAFERLPVSLILVCAILFFASPVLVMLMQAAGSAGGDGISVRSLQRASMATIGLLLRVGFIAVCTAVPLAWLVARFEFPGRKLVETLAVLPLALPTYLAAYCHVSFTDHFGPLQNTLRAIFQLEPAAQLPFLDMRSEWGAGFVIGLALYPYVFVPVRLAFAHQSARYIEAARLLGLPPRQMFWRIALPMAWPAIALGLTLVLLETLNDIGATQYLGVNAMTAAIYQTWVIRDDFRTAVILSLLMLALVGLLIWAERRFQRRIPRLANQRHQGHAAVDVLNGGRAFAVLCLGLLPPLLGFFVPASILLDAAWRDLLANGLRDDVILALGSTVLLAGIAVVVIVFFGFMIALLHRLQSGRLATFALQISLAGYAIPGLMLVIAFMPLAGRIDQSLMQLGLTSGAVLSGSFALVVLAYALRFSGISAQQAASALEQLPQNADHAARSLGARRLRLAWQILVPQMIPAAGAAAILVLVDCIKELPVTILMRPLNVETLATLVYSHASRGAFEDGAVAALLIALAGLVPILFLGRAMGAGLRHN